MRSTFWPSVPSRFSAPAPTPTLPPSGSRSPALTLPPPSSPTPPRSRPATSPGQFERMQAVFHKIIPAAPVRPRRAHPSSSPVKNARRLPAAVEPAAYLAKGSARPRRPLSPEQLPQLHPRPSRRRRRPPLLHFRLTYEYTHYITRRANLPIWLNEEHRRVLPELRHRLPRDLASASPMAEATSSFCARKACFLCLPSSPSITTRPTTTMSRRARCSTPRPGPSPTCSTSTTSETKPTSSATTSRLSPRARPHSPPPSPPSAISKSSRVRSPSRSVTTTSPSSACPSASPSTKPPIRSQPLTPSDARRLSRRRSSLQRPFRRSQEASRLRPRRQPQ